MNSFDITIVGELNVDLILSEVHSFPELGKEILAGKMDLVLGSSSAILASNIASLGAKTGFIGKVGNDEFGRFVINCLENKGINTHSIILDDKLKTGATIILNYPQDRAMVTHTGAMEELKIGDINLDYLSKSRHLHLSSYYLQKGMRKDCPVLFKLARNAGLATSFDTNWDPEEAWHDDIFDVLEHVDVFLPNEIEALNISRTKTVEAALDKLSQYCKIVVIKLGEKGAVAIQDGKMFESKAFKITPVDAVGAGDSFNAGFLFKFLHNAKINQCLEFGNICGALSITQAGGTGAFQNREQIEQDITKYFGYKIDLKS